MPSPPSHESGGDPGDGQLPDGLELVRRTEVFDNDTIPAGLQRAHRVASGVWGRLVVHAGTVRFVFEDQPDRPIIVVAGGDVVIPPARPHHVELDGPTRFLVEFHRPHGEPDIGGVERTGVGERHRPS